MTFASLRSAAEHLARTGTITPHQLAAFTALDQALTDTQRQQFTELWRAQGSPAAPAAAGHQAAAAADPQQPTWLPLALQVIQGFEGCRLMAYPDPATGADPWTIGWGSTRLIDRPVRQGDCISQEQADALLCNAVELTARKLLQLLPMAKGWSPHRIAALVSWAYNVGLGAVEDSSLRSRLLLSRDEPDAVIRQELPRWNRAHGRALAGLTRRRAAEVELFLGKALLTAATPSQASKPATNAAITQPPQPAQRDDAAGTGQSAQLRPGSPLTAHLTPHLRLGEFALDQPARRFQHQYQVDTAAELACFLERVRGAFGSKPVIITSGYRPPAINTACGGTAGSEHLYVVPQEGAVDFYVDGADIHAVQSYCDQHWPHSVGYGAHRGFVHLGRRASGERRRWDY